MNIEPHPAPAVPPTDKPVPVEPADSLSPSEAEMASLTMDLQKIEGYDPSTVAASQSQPVLQPAPAAPSAVGGGSGRGKRKWLTLGIVVAVLLVAGLGSWATYALWYQNPDKVVTDALFNVVSAKTISVSATANTKVTDGSHYTMFIDARGGYKDGMSGTANVSYTYPDGSNAAIDAGAVRTAKGDVYLKLSGLNEAYGGLLQYADNKSKESGESDFEIKLGNAFLDSLIKPIIGKIEDKWLSFKASDFAVAGKDVPSEYSCVSDAFSHLTDDTSQITELVSAYQKHKTIVVSQSLGTKDGNLGFVVKQDKDAIKELDKDLQSTKFYKAVTACDKNKSDPLLDTSSDTTPSHVEVWIDQWSHQLKRMTVELNNVDAGIDSDTCKQKTQSGTADFSFKYDEPVNASAPTGSTPFSDVSSSLGSLSIFTGGTDQCSDSTQATSLKTAQT